MKDLTHIKRFNESEENLNISDVRSSSFDDVLKEYGRDEIIRVLYLWTPFRRSSGDLERMTNEELEFHWKEVVKNYYFLQRSEQLVAFVEWLEANSDHSIDRGWIDEYIEATNCA